MSIRGKREAPRGSFREEEKGKLKKQEAPESQVVYEVVREGDEEADRLDTEKRLEERRKQNAAPADPEEEKARRVKLALIITCAVLAVLLVGLLAYKALFVRPEVDRPSEDGQQEEMDVGDGLQPLLSGERKSKDFYTFLLLGRDTGGGGNCDTMMLISYDMTNQNMTVMSIPRDTMVNVPWDVKKINSVYNNYGGGEKGIEKLKIEVSQLVGFQPDYTMVVEWEAVGELVEAIGGVWFDVPRDMKYKDPYQDLVIDVDAGYQLLDGEAAMGVIRWRHDNSGHGYAEGDIGRIKTQQAFLKAVISQVLQVKNAVKLFEFAEIFQRNVQTELSVQNLFWLGKGAVLGGLTMENVNFVTMPNTPVSCWSRVVKNMQSYVVPQANALLKLVNESLSPFTKVFTLKDLDIMSVNPDGSISSTTGYVEDSVAAVAPVLPSTDPEDPNYDPDYDPDAPSVDPDDPNYDPGFDPSVPTGGEDDPPSTGPDTPSTDPETPDEGQGTGGENPAADGGEDLIDDATGR
ncbi:MAG: LCP family protein [Oscillospiraceae bacterium]